MLRKLTLLAIILALVMGLAAAADAEPDMDWAIAIRVCSDQTCSTLIVGMGDQHDVIAQVPPPNGLGISTGIYSNPLSTSIYPRMFARCVWDVQVCAGTSFTGSSFDLSTWWLNTTDSFRIWLEKGGDVIYFYDPAITGTPQAPLFTRAFSIAPGTCITDFRVVADPIVPEPSSVLALAAGLAGIAGSLVRRRR